MAKAKSKPIVPKAPRPLAGRPTIALNSKTGSVNQLRLQVVGLPKGDLSVALRGLLAGSWTADPPFPPRCPGRRAFNLVITLRGTRERASKREKEPRATNDLTVTITSTPNIMIIPPDPNVPAQSTPELDTPIHVFNV